MENVSGERSYFSKPPTNQLSAELLRDYRKQCGMATARCLNVSSNGRKSCFLLFAFITASVFVSGVLIGYFSKPQVCFKQTTARTSMNYTFQDRLQTLLHTIDGVETEESLRYFSKEPHLAGSKRQKQLAEEIKKRWQSYGLEVDMPEYDVLLSTPDEHNPDYIQIIDEKGNIVLKHTFIIQAKADPQDNKTWNIPQFYPYSPPGNVTGGLLYVNEGRKKDFEYLKTLNISSCNGSVLLIKQIYELHFGEIEQLENAYQCGAVGVILFPDLNTSHPTGINNTYPNKAWLPKESPVYRVIRSTIGDPLTPGLPSTEGIYRLNQNEANLPVKIPVQLVGYTVARELMRKLNGTRMPDKWKPKLDKNMDYHVGPHLFNNSIFQLTVNTKRERQKVYNVIGTVEGNEEPDHWVLIGNHRDAVAFGAADPVSGTAGMMELSRAIGKLLKQGWKPRRTIKFCSWAAEESGLIGSNEWVEDNIKLLQERAVVYINTDTLVKGNYTFKGNGNPMLTDVIFSQTKLVEDPNGAGETIYSIWSKRQPSIKNTSSVPLFFTSGAYTDYQSFYEFAGVPCLDLQYIPRGQTGHLAYHTPYDTYRWIKWIDPQFKFHLAQTKLAARLVFQLSNTLLLPFNLTYLSTSLDGILYRTKKHYEAKLREHNITLKFLTKEVDKLQKAIQIFEEIKNQNTDNNRYNNDEQRRQVQMLNRRMVILNKMFLSAEGVPGRPSIRNLIYGASRRNKLYPFITFIAISDAIIEAEESGDWNDVKHQVSVTQHCITQARRSLQMPSNNSTINKI